MRAALEPSTRSVHAEVGLETYSGRIFVDWSASSTSLRQDPQLTLSVRKGFGRCSSRTMAPAGSLLSCLIILCVGGIGRPLERSQAQDRDCLVDLVAMSMRSWPSS
jgi:hypothetical protein